MILKIVINNLIRVKYNTQMIESQLKIIIVKITTLSIILKIKVPKILHKMIKNQEQHFQSKSNMPPKELTGIDQKMVPGIMKVIGIVRKIMI